MSWIRTLFTITILLTAVHSYAEDSFEDRMIAAINAERAKEKLPPLIKDERLMTISGEWAKKMAAEDRMFHRDTLRPYLKEYDWKIMNENISISLSKPPPEEIVSRWMKSSGHRRNILQDDIQWIGVGVAASPSSGKYYATFNGSGPYPNSQ